MSKDEARVLAERIAERLFGNVGLIPGEWLIARTATGKWESACWHRPEAVSEITKILLESPDPL